MFEDKIVDAIKKVVGEKDVHLETPENEEFGDYATKWMPISSSALLELLSTQIHL